MDEKQNEQQRHEQQQQASQVPQNPHQGLTYEHYVAHPGHYGHSYIPYGYYAGDLVSYYRQMARHYG